MTSGVLSALAAGWRAQGGGALRWLRPLGLAAALAATGAVLQWPRLRAEALAADRQALATAGRIIQREVAAGQREALLMARLGQLAELDPAAPIAAAVLGGAPRLLWRQGRLLLELPRFPEAPLRLPLDLAEALPPDTPPLLLRLDDATVLRLGPDGVAVEDAGFDPGEALPGPGQSLLGLAAPTPPPFGRLLGQAALLLALLLGFHLLWRRWARQRLRARGAVALLEGLPAAAYAGRLQPSGEFAVQQVAARLQQLTGFSDQEMRQPGFWASRIDAADQTRLAPFRARLMAEGQASVEYRFRRADGQRLWLRSRAARLGEGAGPGPVVGLVDDISAERAQADQVQAASRLAALGRMHAVLAHELAHPLSIILLAAENALEDYALEDGAALEGLVLRLRRIRQQAQRARTTIETLRAFTQGQPPPASPVALRPAMEGALAQAQTLLEAARITVEQDWPEALPDALAHPLLLEQVLVNLLRNACDAMRDAAPPRRRLRITAVAPPGGRLQLCLRDFGHGVDAGAAPHLFTPFFTTRRDGEGMGLGLALSRALLRAFGGQLTLRGLPDGAQAVLRLRPAPASGAPASAAPSGTRAEIPSEAAP
ncbi:sensor histidine kinase [Roseomonas sp. 18066]|uniref:sensor histidine kinase n=1 Tax=Roseomonas sp. 18066 TaxID=2681412 RepID=UPI00135C8405|nr:ATP-binding protein [Roseomonas sp. 18066]